MNDIFTKKLNTVALGVKSFSDNIHACGGSVVDLKGQPPCFAEPEDAMILAKLIDNEKIKKANEIALNKYLNSQPVLTKICLASEVIPDFSGRQLLHSGPPIDFEHMCGPMQGAVCGAIVYEGWAENIESARNLVISGQIKLSPCHHHHAVGPMSGVISPSMPVFVLKNTVDGNESYSNLNEGLGKVLRFGANGKEVLDRLKFMKERLAPVLAKAIELTGPIEVKPLISQGLQMGDECHNRNSASTGQLIKLLSPVLAGIEGGADALRFIASNDHFFLNLSMAACKCMLDAASGVKYSSMVVAMSRNGVNFGIRVSGAGDTWFEAPSLLIKGLYFPGYGDKDANPDLGDSAITETAGIGGFAMAASPAIVKFVGGTSQDALNNSLRMREITLGRHPSFCLPSLDFDGTACGIDVLKVLDRHILPIINTGIAHKKAGIGQIGAGITNAPEECFVKALRFLAQEIL